LSSLPHPKGKPLGIVVVAVVVIVVALVIAVVVVALVALVAVVAVVAVVVVVVALVAVVDDDDVAELPRRRGGTGAGGPGPFLGTKGRPRTPIGSRTPLPGRARPQAP
jgi:amino acid transporter